MHIVEYTGGSTGSSLAFVCSLKGYRFTAISSDAFAKEKLQTMRLFEAEVEIIPSEGGKITPDLIPKMVQRANQLAAQPGIYLTRQFDNQDAIIGYRKLGKEILAQIDKPIDVFCAGVGTAGMITGVTQELKKPILQ
jgi:cysteine synthase A